MTPTARTLQALRAEGWIAQVVEAWIRGAHIRRDLWGIGDVLTMKPAEPLLLVQATCAANISARIRKAELEPGLKVWLATGLKFEVWGWHRVDGRWTVRPAMLELSGPESRVFQGGPLIVTCPPRRKRRRRDLTLWGAP